MTLVTETRLLKPVAQATVPARTKPFNLADFYCYNPGFWMYDAFYDTLDLSNWKVVGSTPERSYVALCLKADAYDSDIRKELPETHLSTLEDIAYLIKAQPGGKGFLLLNGANNYFFVRSKNGTVFVVLIRWRTVSRKWVINGWRVEKRYPALWYGPGRRRIFCPGTAII